MADISAIFGVLLIFAVTYPCLLAAWWLLFPATVERARLRVERTPWQSFGLGVVLMLALAIPLAVLLALPFGPAKFAGWLLLGAALTISSIGSAGIAAKMGERLAANSPQASPAAAFLRGAVALELAAFFPVLGWIFVFPLLLAAALGATGFALLRWTPRPAPAPAPLPAADPLPVQPS